MLTLLAPQPESLWDESLPFEVKELPEDLAALDVLLADPELLWPLVERWRHEFRETGRLVLTEGRPTIALETYIRLMVLKQRYRWGYRTLVAEVSDSIHLRRFCRISLGERVPDESTVRKLTRRIGAETVSKMTRALIVKATREKRFRPRAVRIDSTVIEADVKYPTDAGLASSGVRVLAREGRKLARLIGEKKARVRDRSRAMGHMLQNDHPHDPAALRGGQAGGPEVDWRDRGAARALDQGRCAPAGAGRASAGAWAGCEGEAESGRRARGDGGSLREGRNPDPSASQGRADQGPDRLAARSGRPPDPQGQAREADGVWVRQPVGGGDRDTPRRGARGLILPASTELGNPAEETLLPDTVAELERLGIKIREVALDGGFKPGPTNTALADLQPKTVFIAGRQEPGSKRTQRRLRRYRTGEEGRINHLKRRYGLDRSRLKGDEGRQIWTEWAILAYNTDTLAVRER